MQTVFDKLQAVDPAGGGDQTRTHQVFLCEQQIDFDFPFFVILLVCFVLFQTSALAVLLSILCLQSRDFDEPTLRLLFVASSRERHRPRSITIARSFPQSEVIAQTCQSG
jgi:hypothetical protein